MTDAKDFPLVLVVDDDPVLQMMARRNLKKAGFEPIPAMDGDEAISLFNEVSPDIVLLDVLMPLRDGFEVCRVIRNMPNGHHLPVLIMTAADDMESITRSYEAGATDFVVKPLNWVILRERMRYMLRAGQMMARLKDSEARLARAQRIAHLGIWEWHAETESFTASRELLHIYGALRHGGGFGREDFWRAAHPEDRELLTKLMRQAETIGKGFELDHRIVLPNGAERIVYQRVEVIPARDAPTDYIVGTVQDVTERKQSELFERDRNRVLELILRNEPLENVLLRIAEMVENQRPQGLCSLSLVQKNRLFVKAAPSLPLDFVQGLNGVEAGSKSGCCSSAAHLGYSVTATDIATSPHWKRNCRLPLSHRLRACLSAPIVSGKGRILGTVALYYRNWGRIRQADLNVLEAASQLGAVAIEKIHLAERLDYQTTHDALTGLPNRQYVAAQLDRRFLEVLREREKAAFIHIDLDRFKHVNECLGHRTGDTLIENVAERLRNCVRGADVLARMGGDEFLLVLLGLYERDTASGTAQRLLNVLQEPFFVGGQELHIRASIGISIYPDDGNDLSTVQKNADIAMYHAKNRGGDQFQYFTPPMREAVIERLELENELRKGCERNEFRLCYQPQYELKNSNLAGFEALIRWEHCELGNVSPSRFIPVAEQSGLIVPIGTWVLYEACRQNAFWQRSGVGFFRVAVNISASQFLRRDFFDVVVDALGQSQLEPRWLQLEVTETLMMQDLENMRQLLKDLRSLGVSIAMDDFGAGYSSMTQLQHLPVDCLKLDRLFVQEIENNEETSLRSQAMIRTFVGLARNLGLNLIAEGIETWRQHQFLVKTGCHVGQGFLYREPMAAEEVEAEGDYHRFLIPKAKGPLPEARCKSEPL